MSNAVYNLAFDFGASSGRLILSKFEDGKITMEEIHRFANDPVLVQGRFYWDTFRLFFEVKQGLKKAAKLGVKIESVAIDTWGVDYCLLDKHGNIVGNPIHNRDERTKGKIEASDKILPLAEQYAKFGLQFMPFNTLYQLMADKEMRPEVYEIADKLLFMPDLFGYMLTGEKYNEYTIASTSQLLDAKTRKLATKELERLGIRTDLLCDIVEPGTVVGKLSEELEKETGLKDVKVVAVGSHDTASAVCATPFEDERAAFLSCGTWSLLGKEVDEPILTEASYNANFTNEGGVGGKIRLLKNINGLWINQNLRKHWSQHVEEVSFPDIIAAAKNAKNKNFVIKPNDARFTAPINMIEAIESYCVETGQGKPEGLGEIAMAVYNGLTMEYKAVIEEMEKVLGYSISCINMVGGGIQDKLLCELTAKNTGKKVIAGPIEGSVLGNILMQLQACKKVSSLAEGREVIKASFPQEVYEA